MNPSQSNVVSPAPAPAASPPPPSASASAKPTVFAILFAISVSHLLNDTIQALLPSIYPILKESHGLTFAQIGLITFVFQGTGSLLQPLVGFYTDRRTVPHSLATGMGLSLTGLLCLSQAHSFPMILFSAALVGMGSAVFHPEASRIAWMAAGARRGMAQSLFQVGGNAGSSLGPLAALLVVPHGQGAIGAFAIVALIGVIILWRVGRWKMGNLDRLPKKRAAAAAGAPVVSRGRVALALFVLASLIFSKHFYLASMTNYYMFYLMEKFQVSTREAQVYLFVFLFSVAAGTILGGPAGDRFGRKPVIWTSILGVAPFTLWLPHAGLALTVALSICIGLILSSAFSAILVYAQELMPGRVGMIAGLFFGFAFGMGAIGSALLGKLADHQGVPFVFQLCAFLPLLGLLTILLPDTTPRAKARA